MILGLTERHGVRLWGLLALATVLLLSVACDSQIPPPAPTITPDIGATVQSAVAAAMPTATPTSTPDIEATVAARLATLVAMPTPTDTILPTITQMPKTTPTLTLDIDATVAAHLEATLVAIPKAMDTPIPTATPVPTLVPMLTPTPTPMPHPTPTPTVRPLPTKDRVHSLSTMVKRTRPAVVRIEAGSKVGSGVIFETHGQTGYVITNEHLVTGSVNARVIVNDSATYDGTVLGTDSVRDLAMVRICCGSFHSLPFGNTDALQPGDEVIVIGYALGLPGQATITRGVVSAVRYASALLSNVIQTDAAINPGNSGGPMLSVSGKLLGINTFRLSRTRTGRPAEGLGFAISEQTIRQRIPMLKVEMPSPTLIPTSMPAPTVDQLHPAMPGRGTKVQPARANWNTGYFQEALYSLALEQLGYDVQEHQERDNVSFYLLVANGDVDFWANGWFPLHNQFWETFSLGAEIAGTVIKSGGLQGYLVDKASADKFRIKTLADFARPEVKKAFDHNGDGRADLYGCSNGWGCNIVIDHHIKTFGLSYHINHNTAAYNTMFAEVKQRHRNGESVLYYTWGPNSTLTKGFGLVPGVDVVWMEVPGFSHPAITDQSMVMISGVDGCVGDNDPCFMGFAANNINVVANSEFLKENPAAKRLFEVMNLSLGDVLAQNNRMAAGENSQADIDKHAREWAAVNADVWNSWLNQARRAAK